MPARIDDRPRWRAAVAITISAALAIAGCTAGPGGRDAAPTTSPAAATAGQRGAGGTLRLLYWQAPTILNSHLAQGTKDFDAARLVIEPLATFGPDGRAIPVLAAEVPTVQNGGVSRDLTTVTWKLKPDIRWSDGSELTSADVVFTYRFVADKATGASTAATTDGVKSVEAVDKLTVKVTYASPSPNVYQMFMGAVGHVLQERQFRDFIGARAKDAPGNQRPIGTGPYKVKEFKPNDVVIYEVNENYRDPAKPFFSEVVLKGGGDATSAARAVFQTAEADFSWNLQVEATVLRPMIEAAQSQGVLVSTVAQNVERLLFNRADPSSALGDRRSEPDQPHPFLSDLRVRQALAMAVDRRPIADLYGGGLLGEATCNIVMGVPAYTSKNTAGDPVCRYDPAAANRLLDEAGWGRGADGIRQKDGRRMRMLFATTVNPLRQKQQEIVKDGWAKLGLETELKAVVGGTFFGRDGPDTAAKFFADVQMFTNGPESPDPTTYLASWTTAEIRTKASNWSGLNYERWSNKDYDELHARLRTETDETKRSELVIRMNDILVRDVVVIPLVVRKGADGASKALRGHVANPWDISVWDIADWTK